ncbi:LacI family DNA-binding transcriptional regulator [Kutzneria kofuensis]|uniref:LacI family DNA-binding transcriptional regulator n=1 Tax=Kutzneria kofuensis TaxID=103725 RepID=UPI0031EF3746
MARISEDGRRGGAQAVRQASLTDVAELAGVSHMTVSRVINGTGPVRPETRARVQAAIEELDYRPNSAARTLATGKSETLGVVALDSTLFGPASMLYGIEHAAREAGYAITISSVSRPQLQSISDAVEILRRQAVEGILVIAPHVSAGHALEVVPRDVPLVASAPPSPPRFRSSPSTSKTARGGPPSTCCVGPPHRVAHRRSPTGWRPGTGNWAGGKRWRRGTSSRRACSVATGAPLRYEAGRAW